ncbi:MAG: PQQ-dependent sugar dehydrogenase [Methanomassiliicoccus sp.]|nr:PQQ-dependent sugar dehydrogenase [Methanomassiliicoccus sp.]
MQDQRSVARPVQRSVEQVRGGLVEAKVGLKLVADGFANPVAMGCPPDGSGRLFIADQIGRVYIIKDGRKREEPFVDVSHELVRLEPNYDERGLLGLAFHPRFSDNGLFYLFLSGPLRAGGPRGWNCTNHLIELRASEDDRDRADMSSKRVLLSVDKPQMNHNGGHITFGPDGYLYVPLGDGGGENDRDEGHTPGIGNAQDLEVLLGKILRIDVDSRTEGREYGIPADNPFAGSGRPEIFAYGLRNPYHIAFDAGGDRALFAADAGQVRWEEVNIIVPGGNYGWNLKEGSHNFDPEDNTTDRLGCHDAGFRGEELIDPIMEYRNLSNMTGGSGSVIIGGYVYRGRGIPSLEGRYIFGDLSGRHGKADGRLYVGSPTKDPGMWTMDELIIEKRRKLHEYLLALGQDEDNELYVLSSDTEGPSGTSGRVYRIMPSGDGNASSCGGR